MQAIKGFYIHASVFVVVNLGLFIINALTSGLAGGVWWFYWPLLGWGIGLGAHALAARVPELEAAEDREDGAQQEPAEAAPTPAPGQGPTPRTDEPRSSEKPWWRRVFGT